MNKLLLTSGFCIVLAGLSSGCNAVSSPPKYDSLAQGNKVTIDAIPNISTPKTSSHTTSEGTTLTANANTVPIANLKALIMKTAQASKCSSDSDNLSSAVAGVAIVFGRGICQPNQSWVISASRGNLYTKTDALNSYSDRFKAAGIPISDQPSSNNLRHLFTLMYGLMQHESNGRSCVGKDPTQDYSEADSAEAGLFQASWGLHRHDAVMGQLADEYSEVSSKTSSCLKKEFDESRPRCHSYDAITWPTDGNGQSAGEKYQKMAKACPAFATEFTAVGLRVNGGNTKKTGEWNPLMKDIKENDKAKIYTSCETMLVNIEELVKANMSSCDQLFH